VRGCAATRLFTTSTPSITKMDVAPVSATAWFGAMVIALMCDGCWVPYDDPTCDRTRDCVRATQYHGRTIEHAT
jgi:hypothetical protein